jgi:hypothetical protein
MHEDEELFYRLIHEHFLQKQLFPKNLKNLLIKQNLYERHINLHMQEVNKHQFF